MKLLYGNLSFYKIQGNHFMAQEEPFGAKIIPKCTLWVRGLLPFWVLRHSFLSLTDCWWLYNIQLKTSRGVLFLPPSDAYVRTFLYLLDTLIKLYYTKLWKIKPRLWTLIEFFSSGGQESWLSFHSARTFHPPPGNLPDPGIKPASLASAALAQGFFANTPL